MSDKMDDNFSLLWKYINIVIIDTFYHLSISVPFNFTLICQIVFKLTLILSTSSSHRYNPYSF